MRRLISCAIVLVTSACVSEAPVDCSAPVPAAPYPVALTPDEARLLALADLPTRYSPDEIEQIAARAARTFEGGTRAVEAVGVPGGATRSGQGLLTLVDFEGEAGWCVVAADRRVPEPLICFVPHGEPTTGTGGSALENGCIPPNPDPPQNPGLKIMLAAAQAYAQNAIASHAKWADSVETALLTRTGAASIAPFTASTRADAARPREPQWQIDRTIGPLLPVEWSQGRPFNATVVENTPHPASPAGCVAIAAAQIMAYWGHPDTFRGVDIDWDETVRWSGPKWNREGRYRDWAGPMSAAPENIQKTVADLLWLIGDEIGMNYGPLESRAYSSRAARLLSENGFTESTATDYNEASVRRSLERGRPVWIEGASHRTVEGNSYANAHAWVIDGYIEQRLWDGHIVDGHIYQGEQTRGYFHSNFGWGGTDNGFYFCGIFDPMRDPHLPSDSRPEEEILPEGATRAGPDTRAEWIGESYNYRFMLRVFTDIHLK